MNEQEQEAFDQAERSAMTTAIPVLQAIRKIREVEFNERALSYILDELRHRTENSTWAHTVHACDAAEQLSDAVYVLENASDAKLREGL